MRVWVALDGVGHPADAPGGSVWAQDLPTLRPLVASGAALDATLGVPGLPQSGTGQACWLTGQNAVAVMGEHFGPQPGPTLRRLLDEHALPGRLARAGARVALLNHYAPAFLEAQGRRNRLGCFPYAFRAAGVALNPPELPAVRVSLGLGYEPPWAETFLTLDAVAHLGGVVARAAREADLLVVDLWFSDLLGHAGASPTPVTVMRAGQAYLARVDRFVQGLLDGGAEVVLSSDHGNLEDLRVKAHTVARVPLAWSGGPVNGVGDVVQGGTWVARWAGAPENGGT